MASLNMPKRDSEGKLPKFTSMGCYPILYLTGRSDVLCPDCANEYEAGSDDPEAPQVFDINWEDPDLYCDECSQRIESAYAEDKAPTGP